MRECGSAGAGESPARYVTRGEVQATRSSDSLCKRPELRASLTVLPINPSTTTTIHYYHMLPPTVHKKIFKRAVNNVDGTSLGLLSSVFPFSPLCSSLSTTLISQMQRYLDHKCIVNPVKWITGRFLDSRNENESWRPSIKLLPSTW